MAEAENSRLAELTAVTDRDRSRWTVHAARALAEILEEGHMLNLPTLVWQVTGMGLIGTVPHQDDPEQVLQDWRRWVAMRTLELRVGNAITTGAFLNVQASALYRTRRTARAHRVHVVVRASIETIQAPVPPAP